MSKPIINTGMNHIDWKSIGGAGTSLLLWTWSTISLNQVVGVMALLASATTIAVNLKKFFKKDNP